jgi:hypothetical protein
MGKSALGIAMMVVALVNAVFHLILVQYIQYSLVNGLYFLISGILFLAGGVLALTAGKWFRPAVMGLLVLALIDNILIVITASFATPLSGGQAYGWATDLYPPGQVPVFIIQIVLVILAGAALFSKKKAT